AAQDDLGARGREPHLDEETAFLVPVVVDDVLADHPEAGDAQLAVPYREADAVDQEERRLRGPRDLSPQPVEPEAHAVCDLALGSGGLGAGYGLAGVAAARQGDRSAEAEVDGAARLGDQAVFLDLQTDDVEGLQRRATVQPERAE